MEFVFIYLREAHPSDGWAVPGWSTVKDPTTIEERKATALSCAKGLGFKFTTVVDTMDDATAVAYAGWPERLFVVDLEGKIVYAGSQGPWGFHPVKRLKPFGCDGPNKPPFPINPLSLEEFLETFFKKTQEPPATPPSPATTSDATDK